MNENKKSGANKILWIVIAVIVILILVLTLTKGGNKKTVGGADDSGVTAPTFEEYTGEQFHLSIRANGGDLQIFEGDIHLDGDTKNLLELMNQIINQNGGVVTSGEGADLHVSSICGFAEDETQKWTVTINGAPIDKPINEYEMVNGDDVSFIIG